MIPDSRLKSYLWAACRRAGQAFRPSRQRNHRYMMKLFVGFAIALNQDFYSPSVALITAFIEHLASTQRTAAAVLSSISALCAVLQRHDIPIHNFAARSVSLLLRPVKFNKRTPAIQRPPVHLQELRMIVNQLQYMDYAHHLKFAILLLFTTLFRQSNLAPQSQHGFNRTRHLTRSDIRLASSYLQIQEKLSKTHQQITRDRWLAISRVLGSALCLHAAYTALLRVSPTRCPSQPILVFEDGAPMLLSYILRAFKLVLVRAGLGSRGITLHSLRRGCARFLQQAGVTPGDIASHGGWKSAAMYRYINHPTKPAAFRALQALK